MGFDSEAWKQFNWKTEKFTASEHNYSCFKYCVKLVQKTLDQIGKKY